MAPACALCMSTQQQCRSPRCPPVLAAEPRSDRAGSTRTRTQSTPLPHGAPEGGDRAVHGERRPHRKPVVHVANTATIPEARPLTEMPRSLVPPRHARPFSRKRKTGRRKQQWHGRAGDLHGSPAQRRAFLGGRVITAAMTGAAAPDNAQEKADEGARGRATASQPPGAPGPGTVGGPALAPLAGRGGHPRSRPA